MQDFEQVKKKIYKLFANRPGFTDEVIEAITATYLYLQDNYPNPVNENDILDVKDFVVGPLIPNHRTIGNIYINRLLKNVQSIQVNNEPPSKYIPAKKCVILEPDITIAHRLKPWREYKSLIGTPLSDAQEEILADKIRAKVIVHELIHAASDDGIMTGFTYAGHNGQLRGFLQNKYPLLYPNINAGSTHLEEAITEILALNIVGNDNLVVLPDENGLIISRNPESSNRNMNAFAEYFLRTYPDCVMGKFTNGLLWNNKFEQLHLPKWGLPKVDPYHCGPMGDLDSYLKVITNYKPVKINNIKTISAFQEIMLIDYLQNLQPQNADELANAIKDYAAFKIFLTRDVNGKFNEDLVADLNNIKAAISSYATQFGKTPAELNQILGAERIILRSISNDGQEVFVPPYSKIKADHTPSPTDPTEQPERQV